MVNSSRIMWMNQESLFNVKPLDFEKYQVPLLHIWTIFKKPERHLYRDKLKDEEGREGNKELWK